MVNYTTFDDWKSYMQTVVKENGVGAITGPLLQTVLGELSDTAEWLVSTSGSSADARALAAEGWAVGTQRGVPVTEGSPYYQNNSLYWSQQVMATAGDLATLVQQAQMAIRGADDAAAACGRATEAASDATTLATEKAGLAADAAAACGRATEAASDAASLANEKGVYAEQQGDYAKGEIDGAKGDFPTLNDRFNHVDEEAMYFGETGVTADPQLIDEYQRTLQQAYQCVTDMLAATNMAKQSATTAELAARHADTVANVADAASRQATEQAQRAASAADAAEQATTDAANAAGDALSKARMAETAAVTANARAEYAREQAVYATVQGDYAKSMGEALEGQGVFFEEAPLM